MSKVLEKKPYYVNSKLFREQLTKYYEDDIMSNELASNIVKIAEGLSYNYRFINYTQSWKDDMIKNSVDKMLSVLKMKRFKLMELDYNPVAYFTVIAYSAACRTIKSK